MYHRSRRSMLILLLFLLSAALVLPGSALCQTPGAETGLITAIEVNQALSYSKNITTGDLTSNENLVAGKDTAILVRLNKRVTVDTENGTQTLAIMRDGNPVTTLRPSPHAGPTTTLIFTPNSREAVGNWAAGSYEFVAKVGDGESTRSATFTERKKLNILAVPVKANYSGEVRELDGKWKTAGSYTAQVYPLAADGFNWVLGQELDASDSSYDLMTDDGCKKLWEALVNQQVKDENGCNKYELIIGFVRDRQGADGSLQGFTYGKPANIVTESDEDMMATVAHEIAHCYGVGDEYSGGSIRMAINPAPEGMKGTDWDSESEEEITADNPHFKPFGGPSGGEGSSIKAEIPFEFGKRGEMAECASFMGSGGQQADYWVSAPIWEQLFKSFVPEATESVDNQRAFVRAATMRVVDVYAWINNNDTVDATEPWISYNIDPKYFTPKTGGGYSLRAVDAGGITLAEQFFDVKFRTMTNPPKVLDEVPVEELVAPFPAGTAKFVFCKAGRPIGEKPVSANAPIVTITNPQAGQDVSDSLRIEWTATDEDGDKLYYDVLYSHNGRDWITLAYGLETTSHQDTFTDLPGGNQALIKVIASDGVNATEVVSAPFNVALKSPEIYFYEPEDGKPAIYSMYEEILLEAEAYDLQDDWLPDNRLEWKDGTGKKLGNGAYIFLEDMTPGEYQITLTATNSAGLSSSQTVKLTITDKEPPGDYFRPFQEEVPEVAADKAWRITFSQPVDRATVTPENVFVTPFYTEDKCQASCSFENNDCTVIVTPTSAYTKGENYTLWIKDVKSKGNQSLKTRMFLDFTIKP